MSLVTDRASFSIDVLLQRARDRLARVDPVQAHEELLSGALVVDIRPQAQRVAEGEVPGSLVLERNVLEWRLDPTSSARIPEATGHHLRVIVLCSEGYTSSLAAASLHDLGLTRATDVTGGLSAWVAAGLPLAKGGTAAGQRVKGRCESAALPGVQDRTSLSKRHWALR